MNEIASQLRQDYPHTVKLGGNTAVTLRLMTKADIDTVVQFAQSLPENDLLFLRTDITDRMAVTRWAENIEAGRTVTVIAEVNGAMAGYGSLHRQPATWQRHIGEIRILVGPGHRSIGLGRRLADEVSCIAMDIGLSKLMAQMTPDQKAAIASFERLGFQPEALLHDFVIDRTGRTRDMVTMSYDVNGLTDRVD